MHLRLGYIQYMPMEITTRGGRTTVVFFLAGSQTFIGTALKGSQLMIGQNAKVKKQSNRRDHYDYSPQTVIFVNP